jgi:very-short-patch-repair endonuclease
MWQQLRGGKLGHKIRRQHAIDVFIADFICIRKRVIIEIDGDYHLNPEQAQYDKQRTFILEQKGFNVLRFTNAEVEHELAAILSKIKALLDSIPDLDRDV